MAATIKECVCVCVTRQDFLAVATSRVPPFAMVLTAFPKSYARSVIRSMSGESFVLLCSGDDCVVIDSHRYMSGTLQGYIKGSN